MVEQCGRFLDRQFIQVSISAGADNPASITNGVASPTATGTTAAALRHDLNLALKVFTDAGVSTSGIVIVMTSALARGISLLTTTLGVPEFPSMTPEGGTLIGYQVIVSDSVDAGTVVLFQPREIFLADDGRVTLDASREATLDMSGSTTAAFSLWQNNCVAIRAEQFIKWQKRRAAGAVAVIDTAAYAPA
jgi:HK97 family phage major capsid protein